MYLLNVTLYCYKYCIILKPILYHLKSIINIGPSILYTFLQPG